MVATRIRPVSDLRNKYSDRVSLYERIARSERDFAAGRCQNAREALQELRSEFDV